MDWFLCKEVLPKVRSEQTMILHLCGNGKYTSVLCFSIRGDEARVPALSFNIGIMDLCLLHCFYILFKTPFESSSCKPLKLQGL